MEAELRAGTLWGALVMSGLTVACATAPPATAAVAVDAPALTALDEARVKTTMGRMAMELIQIEEVLLASRYITPGDREAVIAHLRALQAAAWELDDKTVGLMHGHIGRNLPRLRAAIGAAIHEATDLTPNLYPAASLAGQCRACHASRL